VRAANPFTITPNRNGTFPFSVSDLISPSTNKCNSRSRSSHDGVEGCSTASRDLTENFLDKNFFFPKHITTPLVPNQFCWFLSLMPRPKSLRGGMKCEVLRTKIFEKSFV
jgi:hypothetical protein